MKKRVRIYKAGGEQGTVINPLSKWMMQMGGPMQQQQVSSEDQIMNILEEAYLSMIEPVDLYETLIQNYQLPEPDALYYVDVYTQKLKEKRADKLNTPDAPNLVIPEEEYMNASEDVAEDAFEGEFRQGGQKSMSKKSFVNNVLKSVKKQTGGVINQSDKPEDAPKIKAETFINAVKAEKEKSELKTQAESMYDNIMQRGGFVDKNNPFYGNPELYKFIGGGPELSKAQDGQNVKQLEKAKQIAANMGYTGSDPVGFLEYMRAADMRSKQGRLPGDVPGATWYPGQHQIHSPWHSQYMGRLGPIYPPLFGAGRWNAGIQYAGSWLKPSKVTTKTTTWKDMIQPRSSSTFIDSEGRVKANIPTSQQTTTQPEVLNQTKRSREEGVARAKGQMLWNYPRVSEYETTPLENVQYNYPDSEDQNFRESKERRFRYPKISEYETTDMETATKITPMVPKGIFESDVPRDLQIPPTASDIYNRELADENRRARQEFELRNRQYGGQKTFKEGGLIKAQTGFNSCPLGYSKDMNPSSPSYGQCVSSTGQIYRGSSALSTPFEYTNPFVQEDVKGMDPESGMYRNMDLPEQNIGMVEETTEYDPQKMWNIDFPQVLNQFNTGVRGALGFFGELGDYGNRVQQSANLTSDNVYLPNPWSKKNRGLYDPNSGLLQPGLMGSNNRSGYARRQFGGSIDDEVEMTEEELQEFLANGGEVEYL